MENRRKVTSFDVVWAGSHVFTVALLCISVKWIYLHQFKIGESIAPNLESARRALSNLRNRILISWIANNIFEENLSKRRNFIPNFQMQKRVKLQILTCSLLVKIISVDSLSSETDVSLSSSLLVRIIRYHLISWIYMDDTKGEQWKCFSFQLFQKIEIRRHSCKGLSREVIKVDLFEENILMMCSQE
jgi:hypothetical protein